MFGDGASPDESLLADMARHNTTMVLYMSLRSMPDLAERFQKHYPDDLPMAVVYFAGYTDRQSVVCGTLGTIVRDIQPIDETWLGLVIIGDAAR